MSETFDAFKRGAVEYMKEIGALTASLSLGGLAAAAFAKGEPLFGAILVCLTIAAFMAFTDRKVEKAKATQALWFVKTIAGGNDTTVTLEVVHRKANEEPRP